MKDDKLVKPKHVIDENLWNVEEITILPEKREEILNELRQNGTIKNIIKISYYKNGTLKMDQNKLC